LSRKKYKFKRRPYVHQVEALKQMLPQLKKTGGFALLMQPRTGKTKVSIDASSILYQTGDVSRVLILCPLGVMDVWEEEIRLNCPVRHRVIMWDKKGRKRHDLPAWSENRLDFVIMNPEALSTPGRKLASGKRSRTRGGKFDILRALVRWQPQLMVVDESHRFKSPSAAKTRMLMRKALRDVVQFRIIQTGTLQTKKKRVVDVYTQFKIMNPQSMLVKGYTSAEFKEEFAVWTSRNGYPQWLRNKNMDRMRRLIHEEAYSITRKEAFGEGVRLPDQIVPVDLTGHTLEVYEQMALDMIARIKTGEITEASIKLVQSLRLAQITSGLAKTTPTENHPEARLIRIGRDKLEALEDLASDWFDADEHVIIGARFRGDIQGVRQLMRKLRVPCYEVHGGIKSRVQRTAEVHGFNQQRGPACFIGQPAAMSLGIDLRSAAIFVWFSLTQSWVDFSQAEDRNALNDDARSYVYLQAKGTVDALLYESMQEDGEIGRLVVKAPERLWIPPT